MEGRTSIEELLEAERKCFASIQHDPEEQEETAICRLRIKVYERLLRTRVIADFGSENEVDELKNEVDSLAREHASVLRRFDAAIYGLVLRLEPVAEPAALAAE